MKKTLVMLLTALACSTTLSFAANKHEKSAPLPKNEHEITVGNEKAATSESAAGDKAVKQEKTQTDHKQDKGEHEATVGNDKAAENGSKADNKTAKQDKTHSNEGKHKSKGHTKK